MNNSEMVAYLRRSGRVKLADTLEKRGGETLSEYSKKLITPRHNVEMDPLLLDSVRLEMERIGISEKLKIRAIQSFEKRRFIQTGPHLTPTISPRMSFISWLSSLSLLGEPYIEFSYSAIPFSNNMMPGAITWSSEVSEAGPFNSSKKVTKGTIENISRKDISAYRWIISKKNRDSLVFGSAISPTTCSVINEIDLKYKNIFGNPKEGDSYTAWALSVRAKVMKKMLPLAAPVLLDGVEIIRSYLLAGFGKEKHVLQKLFSKSEILEKALGSAPIGYRNYMSGKKVKQEAVHLRRGNLESAHYENIVFEKDAFMKLLETRDLCPGSFLFFFTLTFANHVSCAGSFVQAEYLPKFQESLLGSGLLDDGVVKSAPVNIVATGMFPKDTFRHALDESLGKNYDYNQELTLFEVIAPLLELETMYGKV